jgi:AAA domain, putative AbiEii toxin, Type IV TA system
MIKLEREQAPEVLSSPETERVYAEAAEYFADESDSARRRTFNFDYWPWPNDEVLTALSRTSMKRCSFCGRPDRGRAEMAPLRFRPPQDAVAADGRTSRPHYWWLAFEWSNLYLACGDCGKAKGSKFPTEKRRASIRQVVDLNEREHPLLIDPAEEDPEPNFCFLDTGELAWFNERGLITIETFALNRPALVEERREAVRSTKREIAAAATLLDAGENRKFADAFLDLFSTKAPFAALRRQFFNQWVQCRPRKLEWTLREATGGEVDLDEVVGSLRRITGRMKRNISRGLDPDFREARDLSIEVPPGEARMEVAPPGFEIDASAYERGREIQRVEIHNFQGIDSMGLEVAGGAGEGAWLMLLGENGAGKTAALKAVALTLMSTEERDRVLPDSTPVLRRGQRSGSVRVDLSGARNMREFHFGRDAEDHRSTGSQAPLLLSAYGATRLLPGARERADERPGTRTGSLFDPRFPLTRPADWLPECDPDEFDAVARGLRLILQLKDDEEVQADDRMGFTIASPRGTFDLESLSDGYRTMAVLALDLMNLFLRTWGQLDAAEGIVLIDEIGAHLHPRWQMEVVGAMRDTFPRVQFIATTHDPLCLRGLRDGEVVVLRRLEGGRLVAQQQGLPSIDGLTVDQILTSEHFGLFSTLDPELEEMFERYYALLAAPALDEAEQEELEIRQMVLAGRRQLGSTRRERYALEEVDRHLARERFATSAADLRRLPESAREGVRQILEEAE